jgi:hypothetical protein
MARYLKLLIICFFAVAGMLNACGPGSDDDNGIPVKRPDTPANPTPADNAAEVSLTTGLSWDSSAGTTAYYVFFGKTGNMSDIGTYAINSVANADIGTLTEETEYKWQVIASNSGGNTSGAVWSFVTSSDDTRPAEPINPSPTDGATGVTTTTNLGWGDCARATSYHVHFGDTTPPAYLTEVTTSSIANADLGGLALTTTYYWQVIAANADGNTSGAVWSFVTSSDDTRPAEPINPSPTDGATGVTTTTNLDWGDCARATSYFVHFGDATPPAYLTEVTTSSIANADLGGLALTTTYYWQVIAANADGNTSGAVWSFVTSSDDPRPAEPINPSPADGAADTAVTTNLDWDDCALATSYFVHFGDTTPPAYLTEVTTSSVANADLGGLALTTTYYWQVIAANADGNTSGAVWSFVTSSDNPPPAEPINPSPAHEATEISTATDVSWDNCTGADNYHVHFGKSATPAFLTTTSNNKVDNADLGGPLDAEDTYYWYVIATNANGNTTGAMWSFTTASGSAPGTPANPIPTDGATGVSITTDLKWSECANTNFYYVHFGTNPSPGYLIDAYENSVASYDLPSLAKDMTYYWRIIATDGVDNAAGPVWSFVTEESGGNTVWEKQVVTGGPEGRVLFAMAWDGSNVIMQGGAMMDSSGSITGYKEWATWTWDGSTWAATGPEPSPYHRFGHAMCFDNRGALMFGGYRYNDVTLVLENKLMRYSGDAWTELIAHGAPGSPSARYCHAMAYDAARDVVVLFGGNDESGSLGDTWELKFSPSLAWEQKTTGPPPSARESQAMAYASAGIIMYGGWTGSSALSECHLWDGTSWSAGDTSMGVQCDAAMSNNKTGSTVIVFGGYRPEGDSNKTWKWDGSAWKEMTFTGAVPHKRSFCKMAYDRARQEYVMFGGIDLSATSTLWDDTWVLK